MPSLLADTSSEGVTSYIAAMLATVSRPATTCSAGLLVLLVLGPHPPPAPALSPISESRAPVSPAAAAAPGPAADSGWPPLSAGSWPAGDTCATASCAGAGAGSWCWSWSAMCPGQCGGVAGWLHGGVAGVTTASVTAATARARARLETVNKRLGGAAPRPRGDQLTADITQHNTIDFHRHAAITPHNTAQHHTTPHNSTQHRTTTLPASARQDTGHPGCGEATLSVVYSVLLL